MASVESNYTITGGIRFETLVPERVLIIPNQDNIKTWAEFGIKVTNQTSTPYRFIFFNLEMEMIGLEREKIQCDYTRNQTNTPQESDFLLAKPGETLTFSIKAKFVWSGYRLGLRYRDLSNGFCVFIGLKPIKYWVRFTYRNVFPISPNPKINCSRTPWPFSEELWTGIASSPYEQFYLEYPPD
ncbi:hypothetical protein PMG71_12995 [Roseofilum sp. BLCC_M154]|uniref:Uncharacterized protein n=1 Tax=Roseofilum acuticapitatum BLCC-M154 TaxID=3022444 RepID=A0ABT7ATY3_9CYAN|nr:hypothetical protein [Roseofilum acuticapitatum]MDJ1170349.1 hypothetical protein [Roseofilum acuticapitatum BLCC-M154]